MHALFAWLKGLSMLGKAGVVLGSVITVGTASNMIAPPTEVTTITPETSQTTEVESAYSQTVTETTSIPYETVTVDDSTIYAGESVVVQEGQNGEKLVTYSVSYLDGLEISREFISEVVLTEPTNKIIHNGTYVYVAPEPEISANTSPGSDCDSNYSGACVPIASDVDCFGGSGNGPAYVSGPVYVIGYDIYGLDRDNDGVGCE